MGNLYQTVSYGISCAIKFLKPPYFGRNDLVTGLSLESRIFGPLNDPLIELMPVNDETFSVVSRVASHKTFQFIDPKTGLNVKVNSLGSTLSLYAGEVNGENVSYFTGFNYPPSRDLKEVKISRNDVTLVVNPLETRGAQSDYSVATIPEAWARHEAEFIRLIRLAFVEAQRIIYSNALQREMELVDIINR